MSCRAWPISLRTSLDARIEDEDLNGLAEAVEVREALERLQTLSVELSEGIDAYQNKHSA